MANMPTLIKDGALTGALTVTASSTTYSAGIDLKNQESALIDLSMIVELTAVAGGDGLEFSLVGDSALPIDGSSVVYYVNAEVTDSGNVILPLPKTFAHQYVGVKCIAEVGETGTASTFLNVPTR